MRKRRKPLIFLVAVAVTAFACSPSDQELSAEERTPETPNTDASSSFQSDGRSLAYTGVPPQAPPPLLVEGKAIALISSDWFSTSTKLQEKDYPPDTFGAFELPFIESGEELLWLEAQLGTTTMPSRLDVSFFTSLDVNGIPQTEIWSVYCIEEPETCAISINAEDQSIHFTLEVPGDAEVVVFSLHFTDPNMTVSDSGDTARYYASYGARLP